MRKEGIPQSVKCGCVSMDSDVTYNTMVTGSKGLERLQ